MANEQAVNNQSQAQNQATIGTPKHSIKVNSKVVIIIIAFVIGVVLLLLLYYKFPGSQNNKTNPISNDNNNFLIATIGDQKIYKKTVYGAILEQYSSLDVSPEIKRQFLNIVIERAVLDQEAKRLNITVTDEEISKKTNNSTNEKVIFAARYEVLKDKLTLLQVNSIEAYVISYWVPPLIDPQKPIFAQQREDGKKALDEAEKRLTLGDTPLSITTDIYNGFPSLKEIIALNGYIFNSVKDEKNYTSPKLYTFGKAELDNMNDPEIYDAMRTLKAGEVGQVTRSDGSGGAVMKVISVNRSGPSTYEEYISQKVNEMVVYSTTEIDL